MPFSVRPNVLRMVPYSPGKPVAEVKRELGLQHVVKLASNENPFGPSPKAVEAVRRAAESMHIYPDGAAYELRNAIAQHFGVDRREVLLGNGSDELIHLIGLLFLDSPEDEIIVADPGFSRYDAAAHLAPAKIVRVPLDAEYAHDLPAMAEAVTPNTRILFVANPNNPTGTIVKRAAFEAMLEAIPDSVAVILDEAYFEFAADQPDYPNSIDYVRSGKNVIGLRTFSKAYGLAGIRVGYGFASPEIADAIDRAREPFNVNSLAQAAAIAALDDREHVERTVRNNREQAERMRPIFDRLGWKAVGEFANFLFVDTRTASRPIFEALLRQGIIVRAGDVFGTPTCLRISLGTPEEMGALISALETIAVPTA